MNLEFYNELKERPKCLSCDKCNKEFELSTEELLSSEVKNEFSEAMKVTFFFCPHCKQIYIVLIEDKRTALYNEQLKKMLKRLEKCRRHRKEPSEDLLNDLAGLKQRYKTYQFYLKKRYEKHFTLHSKETTAVNSGERKE